MENKIDCTNCAGCDYQCRKEAEMIMNNTPLSPLDRGEKIDLERMNFLSWYRDATVEDLVIARRNNAAKLDELTRKYEADINLMEIILSPRKTGSRIKLVRGLISGMPICILFWLMIYWVFFR